MCEYEYFFQQDGISLALAIMWIIIGLGFSALFNRMTKVKFEPYEVALMCLLWPLAVPILFIALFVIYVSSLKNKAP